MADQNEQENQRQRDRATAWLQSKWVSPVKQCSICLQNNWTITETVEVRQFAGGGLVLGPSSGLYPLFQVICNNCGNTLFFNAALSGVVQRPPSQEGEPEVPPAASQEPS